MFSNNIEYNFTNDLEYFQIKLFVNNQVRTNKSRICNSVREQRSTPTNMQCNNNIRRQPGTASGSQIAVNALHQAGPTLRDGIPASKVDMSPMMLLALIIIMLTNRFK